MGALLLPERVALVGLGALAVAAVALWLLPVGRSVAPGGRRSTRVDERDIMFARARLQPGSPEYDAYYAQRPENRGGDDHTRSLPGLLSPAAALAQPAAFAAARASFVVTEALRPHAEGPVSPTRLERSPARWTSLVKRLARDLGALDVGVAQLRREHIYTHVGRGTGAWGEPIRLDHPWAVAFTVEMGHAEVACAPGAPIVMESARRYAETSSIGVQLASAIRDWGYDARAHVDGNYRVVVPLVARDAGLGDIGRMGLVMTPRLGPRVRIAVVSTELPLVPDRAGDDLAMLDFCSVCRKCAESCPVGAIPMGAREPVDGSGLRWKLNSEACFRYWAAAGTDCGTCMRVCPYSHPDHPVHTVVRSTIRESGVARRLMLWLDDIFYGRRPPPRRASDSGLP